MAFRDILDSAKRWFGPDNPFFHGEREDRYVDEPQQDEGAYYAQQPMNAQPPQQGAYQAPYQQNAYQQPQQQPAYQQPAYQPNAYQQPAYQQPQQPAYQQPQAAPAYQQSAQQPQQPAPIFQQGYQPQQTVNQPYVQPRNRRAAQHMPEAENVVPFPGGMQPMPAQPVQQAAPMPQPAMQPAPQPAAKQASACIINARSIADCRNAIGILRAGDCVIAVMDNIADQAEVRRYVDTLNGACFSLGCTMTRLSARVGVYLLAPVGMQVFTDQATTQMNAQSRAPQRVQRAQSQQAAPAYQQPQPAAGAYRTPYQPQPAAYQQPQQPAFTQQQPVYAQQSQQSSFAAQSPAQGYTPDADGGEYADAVM